ncbi:carbohydrate ABC transporter permease, partial [Plantibacter sp. CFBP 8804]|nr:carbohydrate ABC transporter permease [Plantibacter sp. CFBP 8804]
MTTHAPAPTAARRPADGPGTDRSAKPQVPMHRKASGRKIRSNTVKAILVTLLLVFTLFPAYWMLSSAFDAQASSGGQSFFPKELSFTNFESVLTDGGFAVFLRNSAIVAGATVLISAAVALLASGAGARFRVKF